jgi:hypothetical protein
VKARPQHLSFDADGQAENTLCFGNRTAPKRLLIIPPLFDEMNRARRMLVSAMRALAERDICCFLPDLPGCNESLASLPVQDLAIWRAAIKQAITQLEATHIVAIRGGALIDDVAPELPHWRLAPVSGASLLKTMLRTRIAGDKEAGLTTSMDDLMAAALSAPLELAGTILGPHMIAQLACAEPAALSGLTTRLLGEGPDTITGSALWLRAEPQDDPEMATALAEELARWSSSCGG